MRAQEIRQKFFDFFKNKEHHIVPSAPIVVKNDPTLMFTNAGMNQFKDIFLGNEMPKYPRVADTQKCLRVSGKHNDLEEVGHDTYHHTMFEMLGNWSFGDYFKEEAIVWAWELLTEVYQLPEERLYVTIFEGDITEGLGEDSKALEYWKDLVPQECILKFGKKDNFWEMGETGPCGPCSEIHIDIRPKGERADTPGAALVNKDHPQVIEIWNLVFIEFNRFADGSLKPLPQKHVDTGMGLERLTAVLQNKTSNYDTDIFQPLIKMMERKFWVKYGVNEKTDIALRVIADHCRAVTFTVADGQLPANTGAGYVVRRILRRAVRYGNQFLGADQPFIFLLVEILADQFKDIFPEIEKQKDFILNVIKEEEQSFLRTLEMGTKLFESKVKEGNLKSVPGDFAFELYDTYGFPLDLTKLMARENGLELDEKAFEKELAKQKSRSKVAAEKEESDWVILLPQEKTEFIGYDYLNARVRITRYRKVKTKKKEQYQLVFDKTPFYAESGGQVGDTGVLKRDGETVKILDTVKENKLILHLADKLPSEPDEPYEALVDVKKRKDTVKNHSATHLLHAALKQVLGNHVNQKGSLVAPGHLRFDFSHFAKVEDHDLRKIEEIVNEKIRENIPIGEEREVELQTALDRGVTALFGEKYEDKVRVITFDDNFSQELCGGTHVQATGEIGLFKIVSESAIAAGIRRIEAVTGQKALEIINDQIDTLDEIKAVFKNPKNPVQVIEKLVEENKSLKKQIEQISAEKVSSLKEDLLKETQKVNENLSFLGKIVELDSPDAAKKLVFDLRDKTQNTIILIGAGFGEKANIWLFIPEELTKAKSLNAGNLIREIALEIQGGGGGQPFFATAGGSKPENLEKAIQKGKALIFEKLN